VVLIPLQQSFPFINSSTHHDSAGLTAPNIWKLTDRGRAALLTFMAILLLMLILPARIVDKVFPGYYGRVSDAVTTFTMLIMLGISMFLLRRFL